MAKKIIFVPEFHTVQFMTKEEKLKVYRAWCRFLKGGLKEQDFSDALYKHLSLHCEFIAHYNRGGFYQTYFTNPEDTKRFFTQFDRHKGCVSVEYGDTYWIQNGNDVCTGYYDINNAMVDVAEPYLNKIYSACDSTEKVRDIQMARALLAKHGIPLGEV